MNDRGAEPREWTIPTCSICGALYAPTGIAHRTRHGSNWHVESVRVREVLSPPPGREDEGDSLASARGQRLYATLGLFDTRDGSKLADLVRAAREGWERSDPEMNEPDAWEEFEARRARLGKPGEPLASPNPNPVFPPPDRLTPSELGLAVAWLEEARLTSFPDAWNPEDDVMLDKLKARLSDREPE